MHQRTTVARELRKRKGIEKNCVAKLTGDPKTTNTPTTTTRSKGKCVARAKETGGTSTVGTKASGASAVEIKAGGDSVVRKYVRGQCTKLRRLLSGLEMSKVKASGSSGSLGSISSSSSVGSRRAGNSHSASATATRSVVYVISV